MKTTETSIIVNKSELKALMEHASQDITRFHLNGVFVEFTGTSATLVATDGHRLVTASCVSTIEPKSAIIPMESLKSAVSMLRKKTDTLRIELLDGGEVLLECIDANKCSGGRLVAKCIDSVFPPWRNVVPRHSGRGQDLDGADSPAPTPAINLRPKYLADLGLIEKAIAHAGEFAAEDMRLLPPAKDLDPFVFIAGRDTEWTAVIMPRRGHDFAERSFSKVG